MNGTRAWYRPTFRDVAGDIALLTHLVVPRFAVDGDGAPPFGHALDLPITRHDHQFAWCRVSADQLLHKGICIVISDRVTDGDAAMMLFAGNTSGSIVGIEHHLRGITISLRE